MSLELHANECEAACRLARQQIENKIRNRAKRCSRGTTEQSFVPLAVRKGECPLRFASPWSQLNPTIYCEIQDLRGGNCIRILLTARR
jgi:hypothetical protein